MSLQAVLDRVHSDFEPTIAQLLQFCAQPSVSGDGRGMDAMPGLVKESLEGVGASVEVFEREGHHPLLLAEFPSTSHRKLSLYNHYDVQPPEPLEAWSSPPFEPVIRDGRLFARGVADNKGAIVSRLAAIRALRDVTGEFPVGIQWIIEGEEESGSGLLRQFVPDNWARLQSDGLLWEEASADQHGNPVMRLGNKGMLHVELRAHGPNADLHSRFAGILPNPIWKLLWAAESIRDKNGEIRLPGFMDEVVAPTKDERQIYRSIASGIPQILTRYGVKAPFPAGTAEEVAETLYHQPTCNITGITGGYTGQATKTVLPSQAQMRLEFRLVPKQDPQHILKLLREHLDREGFSDVQIIPRTALAPSKTPLDDPFAKLVGEAATVAYNRPLTIEPSSSGSGPRHIFTSVLDIPIVAIGVSYAGSMIHGADENVRLEDVEGHARHVAAILYAMEAW